MGWLSNEPGGKAKSQKGVFIFLVSKYFLKYLINHILYLIAYKFHYFYDKFIFKLLQKISFFL